LDKAQLGFAGLHRAEIERLEWKDIHFDLAKYRAFTQAVAAGNKETIAKAEKEWRTLALIEVPALKSTASRRFVQIQDNLAAWLGTPASSYCCQYFGLTV
jgi:hypothetical protein